MLSCPQDIVPGVAVLMDSRNLSTSCVTGNPAAGFKFKSHFCICIDVDNTTGTSLWLPVFSDPGTGRCCIGETEKNGHPKWKDGFSYYHIGQMWALSTAAAITASCGDKSTPSTPNSVTHSCLTKLQASCAATIINAKSITPC